MYENEFLVLMYLPCKSYKLKKENKIKKSYSLVDQNPWLVGEWKDWNRVESLQAIARTEISLLKCGYEKRTELWKTSTQVLIPSYN